MIALFVAVALQAASPAEVVPVSAEQPAAASAPEAQAEAIEMPQPKGKRVCRSVVDPRTRDLSQRRQVCRFVPDDTK